MPQLGCPYPTRTGCQAEVSSKSVQAPLSEQHGLRPFRGRSNAAEAFLGRAKSALRSDSDSDTVYRNGAEPREAAPAVDDLVPAYVVLIF